MRLSRSRLRSSFGIGLAAAFGWLLALASGSKAPLGLAQSIASPTQAIEYLSSGASVMALPITRSAPAIELGKLIAWLPEVNAEPNKAQVLSAWSPWGTEDRSPLGFPGPIENASAMRLPIGTVDACDGCQGLLVTSAARISELYVWQELHVGQERKKLTHLEISIRAQDGYRVYLNQDLVAERWNVPLTSGEPSDRASSGFWQTHHIPLSQNRLPIGRNIIAIAVKPAHQRQAPMLDITIRGRSEVGLSWGPLVSRVPHQSSGIETLAAAVSPAEATELLFDTQLPREVDIELEFPDGHRETIHSAEGKAAQFHRVRLPELPPRQFTRYRLLIAGHEMFQGKVLGPPRPRDVIRFAVYGDTYSGHGIHQRIIESILAEAPDFVVNTGDMVLRGYDQGDWQQYFSVTQPLTASLPLVPTVGNHDVVPENLAIQSVADWWGYPKAEGSSLRAHWYGLRFADLQFLVLDSNAYGQPAQFDWLTKILAQLKNQSARAVFVLTHDGPYSRGSHSGNSFAEARFAPLLRKFGITYLFSGHDHTYQRGNAQGLRYIVTGGGGSPLYSLECRGRKRCRGKDDGWLFGVSEHHYVMVTVFADALQVCAKRPDGTLLEPCQMQPLK